MESLRNPIKCLNPPLNKLKKAIQTLGGTMEWFLLMSSRSSSLLKNLSPLG
jgi:hypothetical protein